MDNNDKGHTGHRQRMVDNFINYPESFTETELLEIMLYPCFVRQDTNPLARRLLNTFGSLKNVLKADKSLLMSVDGVGASTCKTIMLNSIIAKKIVDINQSQPEKFIFSKFKPKIIERFKYAETEYFELYLLDSKGYMIDTLYFESTKVDEVEIDLKMLAKSLAVIGPKNAVMAHNHFSGNVSPTSQDDTTTSRLAVLLELHGVNLLDHIIVCGNNVYSYFYNNREMFKKEKLF